MSHSDEKPEVKPCEEKPEVEPCEEKPGVEPCEKKRAPIPLGYIPMSEKPEVKPCDEKPEAKSCDEKRAAIPLGYIPMSEKPAVEPCGDKPVSDESPSVEPCKEKPEVKSCDEKPGVKPCEEKPGVEPCEKKPEDKSFDEKPAPIPLNSIPLIEKPPVDPCGDKPVPLNSITPAQPIRQTTVGVVPPDELGFWVNNKMGRSHSNRPSPPNSRMPRPPFDYRRRDDRPYPQQQQQQPPRGTEPGREDGGVSDVTSAMSGMGLRENDNRLPPKPGPQRMPNQSTFNSNRPNGRDVFSGSGYHNNSSNSRYVPRNNNNNYSRQFYNRNNPYPQHQGRPFPSRGGQYHPNNAYPPMMPLYPPPFPFPGYAAPTAYMQMPMAPMMQCLPFPPYQVADQAPAMPGIPGMTGPVPDNRQIVPGAKCEVFASDRKYYPATILTPLNTANNSVTISFDATGFHANVHINTLKFTTGG